MPSGSFRPSLTIVLRSEPSGLAERMRPPLRSKKNKRLEKDLEPRFVSFLLVTVDDINSPAPFERLIRSSPSLQTTGSNLHPWRLRNQSAVTRLHEGAQAGNGFADDQVLHLIRAFVG